ncbi:hypothetical protein [uncultured Duncaniella sp.]|uniref:hypothetical protein n=1 Tax=uncultured Duncaniella sp. TaxID=2768039 RepID=UPI0025A9330D|nr:hypothetical protein [uncultured Duncaniella sp.]
MRHRQKKTRIDWEKRQFELASALFYYDLRQTADHAPSSRIENWPLYVRVAAEMAVEAADKFIREYRRSIGGKDTGGSCHAP